MKITLVISELLLMAVVATQAADPVAQITFRVTDDLGNVVTGAPVTASTFLNWSPGAEFGNDEYSHATGATDTNGLITLTFPSKTGKVRFFVSGDYDGFSKMTVGDKIYYVDRGDSLRFTNQVADQWKPWNPTLELTIMEVLNPVALYARRVDFSNDERIPVQDEPIGYDLLCGDWVSPHGEGKMTDIVFILHQKPEEVGMRYWGSQPRPYRLYDVTLGVRFPNDGDGLHSVYARPRQGSILRIPREAPDSGYVTSIVKRVHNQTDAAPSMDEREDQNYFFRVRTGTDESGDITNALYGKIYGDIKLAPGGQVRFVYYLNPNPNDRNLEFDPSQNLFENLSGMENVREP